MFLKDQKKDMRPSLLYFTLLFSHLADTFIQSDLQIRKITKTLLKLIVKSL